MRKLKIIEHISLDGVIQVFGEDGDFPYGDWTAPSRPFRRGSLRSNPLVGRAGELRIRSARWPSCRELER